MQPSNEGNESVRDGNRKECRCSKKFCRGKKKPARALSLCLCKCVDMPVGSSHVGCRVCKSQFRPPQLPFTHLGPLPQRLPLDLSRRTLGHLVHNNHTARQVFMFRNLGLDPRLYLLLARRSLGFELDVGSGMFLGVEGFLDADDTRVGDGGVGEEDGFELGGSDLEAGDLDEFLLEKIDQRQFCRIQYSNDDLPSIDPQCRTIPFGRRELRPHSVTSHHRA